MKFAHTLFAAAALTVIAAAPAQAGHDKGSSSGGSTMPSSPSDGKPGTPGDSPSSSGGTSVPEPSDAILLLMGAAGVVIGRKLHARAKRRA